MSLNSSLKTAIAAAQTDWDTRQVDLAVAAVSQHCFLDETATLAVQARAQGALRAAVPKLVLTTRLTSAAIAALANLHELASKGVIEIVFHDSETTIVQNN